MRLNLGAGGQRAEDWTALDRAGDVDIVHDLTDLPLPINDGACEAAVAHHVLDLLPADQIRPLFRELQRIVAPNGWVRISGADLIAGVWAVVVGSERWFAEPRGTVTETLDQFLHQGGARRTPLTAPQVQALLTYSGFVATQHLIGETGGPAELTVFDSRVTESYFVEGRRCV